VDSGDMLWSRSMVGSHEKEQREVKAGLLLEAAGKLGLDAMAPGDGDLAFGLPFLREGAKKHGLPYVSANLSDSKEKLVFPPYRVVEKGKRRIGITSVVGEEAALGSATVKPWEPELRKAVSALREQEKVDLVVLLSHLGMDKDRELALSVPGIDLLFGAHSRSHQEEPVILGRTAIYQAGSQAKYLGVTTLDFRPGAEGWVDPGSAARTERQRTQLESQIERYEGMLAGAKDENERRRLERVHDFNKKRLAEMQAEPAESGPHHVLESAKVPMSRDLDDEPALDALVKATLKRLGEVPVGERGGHGHGAEPGKAEPAEEAPAAGFGEPVAPARGDFVGAAACRACHVPQHEDWRASAHAHAYQTLVRESRQYDLDCWSCHVTGAGQDGGPRTPKDVGDFANVQCEACHGPGRQHVANPKVDMTKTPQESQCKGCHSDEQTMGRFVMKEYWPKVDHK
jgi:hypothetical protein